MISLAIDGGILFTGAWDGVARAWDARRGKQLLSFGEQAVKKRMAKQAKKASGSTAVDSGKGTLKCVAVDDGELFTTQDKHVISWCWEREPLVLAAAAQDNTLLRELLDAGAVVDAQGAVRERTALMHAAIGDNATAAKALLEAGADFDAEDTLMRTPVDYASAKSQDVSKVILDAVDAPMKDWDTPLCKLLLASEGLNEYISLFEDLEFDGETMMLLDDESLRLDLGIKRGNHRATMLRAIRARVKADGSSSDNKAAAAAGGESSDERSSDRMGGTSSTRSSDAGGGDEGVHGSSTESASEQTASSDEDGGDGGSSAAGSSKALAKLSVTGGGRGGRSSSGSGRRRDDRPPQVEVVGANYDEYGRRKATSSHQREGVGAVAGLGKSNAMMAELITMREAMHTDNEMTQRQLALMQDENRKMRSENVALRDQLVETKDLLEQIRDRSIEAMESMEGGQGGQAGVGGDGVETAVNGGAEQQKQPAGKGSTKVCVVM